MPLSDPGDYSKEFELIPIVQSFRQRQQQTPAFFKRTVGLAHMTWTKLADELGSPTDTQEHNKTVELYLEADK